MTVDYLRHMLVELTPACNLHCIHCYNGWKREEADALAGGTYRKAFRVVDFLVRHTLAEHLIFTGASRPWRSVLRNWSFMPWWAGGR